MINNRIFMVKKNGNPVKSHCYCRVPELIENYEKAIADRNTTWRCHHKLEAWFTREELIDLGRYYDCQPRELVFCKDEKEHRKWPHKGDINRTEKQKGRKHSEETKAKMRKPKPKGFGDKLKGNQNAKRLQRGF